MGVKVENSFNRKKFFEKIGKAALVIGLASVLPIKFFGTKKKRINRKIKVYIHPSAVKRSGKV